MVDITVVCFCVLLLGTSTLGLRFEYVRVIDVATYCVIVLTKLCPLYHKWGFDIIFVCLCKATRYACVAFM